MLRAAFSIAALVVLSGCTTFTPPTGIVDVWVPPQGEPVKSVTRIVSCAEAVQTPTPAEGTVVEKVGDVMPCVAEVLATAPERLGEWPHPGRNPRRPLPPRRPR